MKPTTHTETSNNIRLATIQDLQKIQTCASDAYAQYISIIGRKPAPMDADYLNQIKAGFVFVAEYQYSFAGFIVIYSQKDYLHIENVAVSPEHTRKGIGRMLIDFAEQTASKSGLSAVELYTNQAMSNNIVMYPKLGYTQTGKWEEDGFKRVYFRKEV